MIASLLGTFFIPGQDVAGKLLSKAMVAGDSNPGSFDCKSVVLSMSHLGIDGIVKNI